MEILLFTQKLKHKLLLMNVGSLLGMLTVSVLTLLCSGCGALKTSGNAIALKAQQLKADGAEDNFNVNQGNSGGSASSGLLGMTARVNTGQLPNEADIVWAPEDPDQPIEQLEELWSKPIKDAWYDSYEEAMQTSRQSGRPVLIWFTNSASSPTCKLLSAELFSRSQFKSWADEKVIRLRVDANILDDNDDRRVRKEEYVNDLKKRYKVLGAPVVVLISPRGSVFGKYRGYKSGDPVYYLGRLKNAQRVATRDYGQWREEMEKKGYRVWHDRKGRSLFAKLLRYSKGRVLLIEPDGKKSQTVESRLSKEDRNWIQEQKASRG